MLRDYERRYKETAKRIRKKKTALTAEVSCQGDIQQNCCMNRMMENSRGSIWRSWREIGENGKTENSSRGRILKGEIMS